MHSVTLSIAQKLFSTEKAADSEKIISAKAELLTTWA